jgi:1-acyl-sn-glycerol-3-phosphate acyltransferase
MLPRKVLTVFTLITATLLVVPPILVMSLFPKTATPIFYMMKFWAFMTQKAMGFTWSIDGREKIEQGVSYIIAPNHQGHADSLALTLSLPVKFRWVMKRELLKIPLFGWALGRTGAISLNRTKGSESIQKLRSQAGRKLEKGWCVLVYPEGARARDGRLQQFKKGAFVMAIHSGKPILPVAVQGAYSILRPKTLDLRKGHISVSICDPIDTTGLTEADIPGLMKMAREAIAAKLGPEALPLDLAPEPAAQTA